MEVVFLFYCFCSNLNSQPSDSLRLKYINQSIYRNGVSFMKGSEKISFKELGHEFSMSDLGFISYNEAKKYRNVSKVLSYISLLSGFIAIGTLTNQENKNLAYGFYGGQVVFMMAAIK